MGAVRVALVRRWRSGHAKNGCSASDDTHYNIVQRVNHRFDEIVNDKDTKKGSNDELSLTNIKLNVPLTRKQFQAKPSAGSVQSK